MPVDRPGYGRRMGLRDLFRRSADDASGDEPAAGGTGQRAPASDDEPGSVSSQLDVEGRGPVTLDDRTRPGGQASPDTNQGKTEPMPAPPGQPDPNAPLPPPDLDSMNVGAADPQLPSAPAARERPAPPAGTRQPSGPVNPGAAPPDERPGLDPSSTTLLPEGPELPSSATPGSASRRPGSLGDSPEEQETDVDAGAARMQPGHPPASSAPPVPQPGDSQAVPVPSDLPAPGTSEEQSIVHGVRAAIVPGDPGDTPVADGRHADGTVDRDVAGRPELERETADRTTPGAG